MTAGLLAVTAGSSFAGRPGTTAANFLKLAVGPRQIGMGEAGTAVSNDVYAMYWNPAGLARLDSQQTAFMYNRWFQSVDQQFLGYAIPHRNIGTLGLSLYRLGIGNIQGLDAQGGRTQMVKAGSWAAGLSWARKGSHPLSVGFTLKWIREGLAGLNRNALGADLGLQYQYNVFQAGLAVSHLGTAMKFDREAFPLPLTIRLGVAYALPLGGLFEGDRVTVSADGIWQRDDRPRVGFGAEYDLRETVRIRLGYKSGDSEGPGLRAGLGFQVRNLEMDYALASFGGLGAAHRFSVSFRFGSSIRSAAAPLKSRAGELVAAGDSHFREGRYWEAYLAYWQAAKEEPQDGKAHKRLEIVKKVLEAEGFQSYLKSLSTLPPIR